MTEPGYQRIVEALEAGRRALLRAQLLAGGLRFLGVALATLAGLVLWALLQRALQLYSVPLATAVSLIGAGVVVFTLVRWVVVPLVRMPDRDAFVSMVEKKFPGEKNLIVNAYQLGDSQRGTQGNRVPDLVHVLIERASSRIENLDLRRWRDPAPDRPFLWAGGSALAVIALLGVLSPGLLSGALGQVLRPTQVKPPEVTLAVRPGDLEVDRGSDVSIEVEVSGTGKAPLLHYRERNGDWRTHDFAPRSEPRREGGEWTALLPEVDRPLEYRVEAPRAESPVYTIQVRETPRLAGFRAHLDYPDYTGLPTETLTSGTGDLTALKGTAVGLHVLTNRPLSQGHLEWQDQGGEETQIPLTRVDDETWKADLVLDRPASYAVVLLDESGSERLRSPRYPVQPAEDRYPYLTMHFPQEDHDLADDMMERIVVDAADDYGFHSVQVRYRVDDGPEKSESYRPFVKNQTEFRLDTLWDLNGIDLLPGQVVSYYVEVRDNDTVSGPKAVRSPVRRVRFPTLGEMYEEVAEDHGQEIDALTEAQKEHEDLREKLDKLNTDLKRGREMDWEMQQDVQKVLDTQTQVEQQISEVVERLKQTLDKASDRAQMNQDLVQKMSEINQLLESLADEDLKRSFRELSRALERMDRNAMRKALEDFSMTQEQMLRGMDRTVELLKQVRREEQMEDVVRRTDEIAQLQEQIAKELEKLGLKPEDVPGAEDAPPGERNQDQATEPSAEGSQEQAQKGSEEQIADEAGQEGENQKGDQASDQEAQSSDQEAQSSDQEAQSSDQEAQSSDQEAESSQEEAQKNQEGESAQSEKESAESQDEASQGGDQQKSDQAEGSESEESQESKNGSQGQSSAGQQSPQSGSEKSDQEKAEELAREQERAQQMVEELQRLLKSLQKLNQDNQEMSQAMDSMQQSQVPESMKQNMQQAQQSMSGGMMQKAAPFAFKAKEESSRLANMARNLQMQMGQSGEDDTIEAMERVIKGLIDVSGVQEELSRSPGEDPRLLAQRQFDLTERAEAQAESLQAVMKKSFTIDNQKQKQLDLAIQKMTRATEMFELGTRDKAEHQARESVSDVNETIVQLMKSHQQMCSGSGGGGGDMQQKMQGLSEGQQSLNRSTRGLMERLASQDRLSMSDQQRMAQLAAQQEMIRQGLEELLQDFEQTDELLGDMTQLTEDMKEVEGQLKQHKVDPRIKERQQQILSRMLDAQRSIRQREMSPERQSRTATLAERASPPPIPEGLLDRQRTLEEDVLRGANDRYPPQYQKLVEEYFRALARENGSP